MRFSALLLAMLVITGCSDSTPIKLEFDVRFQDQKIRCLSEGFALNDLRLYASEFTAVAADGRHHPLTLQEQPPFQTADLLMIDLESGEGACHNGTPGTNSTGRLLVPDGLQADLLEFTIGVPFVLNHQNPLLAEAPLDDSAMHWHWRSGYKFLRAGLRTGANTSWVHLGSSGCKGRTTAIESCANPNRVRVSIPYGAAVAHGVGIHLDPLFAGIDLSADQPFDCSSGPLEESCSRVFSSLGLVDNAEQQVFRANSQ